MEMMGCHYKHVVEPWLVVVIQDGNLCTQELKLYTLEGKISLRPPDITRSSELGDSLVMKRECRKHNSKLIV
jgi:hypothetical protein